MLVCLLGCCCVVLSAPVARAAWNEPSAGPLDVTQSGLAANSSVANVGGDPYVAWDESSAGSYQVFVKRLVGSSWVRVGGSLNVDSAIDADGPDIASVNGVPFVTWVEHSGSLSLLYVKRFTGTAWVLVGGGALDAMLSRDGSQPTITSIGGVPYVAWVETQQNGSVVVLVKRFVGGSWSLVGPGILNVSARGIASSPKLADVSGLPYVTWYEFDGAYDLVHVRRFDGTAFVPVGRDPLNLSATENAVVPSIAVVGGVPYVAWGEASGVAVQLNVARLAGGDWQNLGGPLNVNPAQDANAPTIASVGGAPAVTWQEDSGAVSQIRFARFDGVGWDALGGPLNVDPSQNASFVDPALADVGGVPYVTWEEANGNAVNVRVKRLEPEILAESATPSATGVTFTASVDDNGMPLPVGFEYGARSLNAQTPIQSTSGASLDTITVHVSGLTPGTRYLFRAFGSDGVRETATGLTQSFSTLQVPGRLTALAINPTTFVAAKHGGSIAAGRFGATVSYRDTEPGTTTFTVQRAVAGRRAHGRCARAGRANRRGARCTLYRNAGSFRHNDSDGVNRFHFSGRVNGRALAPGRYRLRAVPKDSAGSGPVAFHNFTIRG